MGAPIVRVTLAAAVAALLPFAGSAHASCLDDATARDPQEGYSRGQRSEHWLDYVHGTGTATVTFEGDALASDAGVVAGDNVRWASIVSANAADIATDFADCVAG